MKDSGFTHIDSSGNPSMVDISEKNITRRQARAQAIVQLGEHITSLIEHDEIMTRKGPVFQTAILAGIMGAKKTSELIPLCHPLPLEDCQVVITMEGTQARIISSILVTAKTGAEMEALTAVSTAALTIYDMCKALSHDITITEIRLLEKTGGKHDFKHA